MNQAINKIEKSIVFILIIFFPLSNIIAQKGILIDDVMKGKYSVRKVIMMKWRPGTSDFTYIKDNALQYDGTDVKAPQTLITLSDIASETDSKVSRFPSYLWINQHELVLVLERNILVYDLETNRFTTKIILPNKALNIDLNKNFSAAYTIDNDLWIIDSAGGKRQITRNESGILSGREYVYREEWGTSSATFWSPTGKYLAFYEDDQRDIPDYPLLDFTGSTAVVKTIKYPFTGKANERVRLGIYNISTGETLFLNTGTEDQFLTNPSWSPDEKTMYVSIVNRAQNRVVVRKFDVSTGNTSADVIIDSSNTYVEPRYPLYFLNNNKDEFIFISRRDGFQHMYLYNRNGKLLRKIDPGNHELVEFKGLDEKKETVYFTAVDVNNPTEQHFYKAILKNSNVVRLTSEPGVHNASFNGKGLFIDSLSSNKTPFTFSIKTDKNELVKTFFTTQNPVEPSIFPSTQFVTILAADGKTLLHGNLIKPADFDSSRKYPVFIYVYGGPRLQVVQNSWSIGLPLIMASKGFIVFFLDNRGTANRGQVFESSIYRQMGSVEVQDQLKGVEYLKSLPYVDTSNIGVHGWSYGGYMTLKLMEAAPGTFRYGIAGAPVTDWKNYEIMYGERYMDTPSDNAAGYLSSSTLNDAQKIKGSLLLLSGGIDYKTVPKNIADFLNACITQNVYIDFFQFPNHDHDIDGTDKTYLLKKICNYALEKSK